MEQHARFFSVSKELALPTKPMELNTDRVPWNWTGCDCSAASPCFSQARCDALVTHQRVPSVPPALLRPGELSSAAPAPQAPPQASPQAPDASAGLKALLGI